VVSAAVLRGAAVASAPPAVATAIDSSTSLATASTFATTAACPTFATAASAAIATTSVAGLAAGRLHTVVRELLPTDCDRKL